MKNADFGQLLAELRENIGMTQLDVAQRVKVTQQEVAAWEANEEKPTEKQLFHLASMYDVSQRDLLILRDEDIVSPVGVWAMLGFSLLCALSGFFLYHAQLGGRSALWLIVLSVISCALFAVFAVQLEKKAEFSQVFIPSVYDGGVMAIGALLMAVSGVVQMADGTGFARVLGLWTAASAASLLFAAILRMRAQEPKLALYILPMLLYVCKLFVDFRQWMVDPKILDYCFMLFAAISFMLTTYHAAEFCFDKGKRRRLAFFALCGVYFGGVSLAAISLQAGLFYAGGALWCVACALQSLRPDGQ